jgi:lysyl-tRNA synthetase class 2
MKEHGDHIESRLKKLRDLKEAGVEPFAGAFGVEDSAAEVIKLHGDSPREKLEEDPARCSLAGRLVAMRAFGKAAFAHLDDGSGKLQVYFKKDILGDDYLIVKKLDVGDIVGVRGKLFRTKTDELTLEVDELKLLTKSVRPLPEKWHGLKDVELRYRQRYLDLIVNPDVKTTFRKRSAIISAIRESRGYIEVETPMMQSIPGGAAAKPFQTHHNALGLDLYLRIAPELYLKRLLIGGYGRIYELNRNFRNEGISTKHNPEFSMLEFYTAYKDYNYLMSLTEELIAYTAEKALGTMHIKYGNYDIDLTPPWPRVPMLDAMLEKGVPEETFTDAEKARKWAEAEKIELPSGAPHIKILDEIFKEKVEAWLVQPTFITDYPVELSPLARRKPESPELVERFELFVACQEIANAFSELTDPMDQRERFLSQAEGDEEAHPMDEDFVTALEHGMPPAAGEGIGIDRLVMILTNSPSIRDVIFFPHLRPKQERAESESPEEEAGG